MAQINLGGPALAEAYYKVRDGQTSWMVATLPPTNELKLQGTGDDIDDLAEEFEDGRIQFGFVRVQDPISKLPRLVLIQWCGEGVPVMQKGLFSTHAATIAARLLKGSHITIQARGQDDLDTASIMKRVSNASGSKYSINNEPAQKMERPAPTGSSYVPVGRPDIASLTAKAKPEAPARVGTDWTSRKDELADIRAGKSGNAPIPAAPRPGPPPVASRPTPPPAAVTSPLQRPTPVLAPTPPIPSTNVSSARAPPADERPAPVGTAYTPVSLGKPGKLGNRFPFGQQADSGPSPQAVHQPRSTSGMTWSQRQEAARKQREEEDAAASAAISSAPAAPPAPPMLSRPGGAPAMPVRPRAPSPEADDFPEPEQEDEDAAPAPPPPPPPPPMPIAAGANLGARLAEQEADGDSGGQSDVAVLQQTAKLDQLKLAEQSAHEAAANRGQRAVVLYDYQADEDNEMSLVEGEEIFNVEQPDPDWWTAEGENGAKRGMFPSNYVQLIEEDEASSALPAPPAPPMPPRAPEPESEPEAAVAPPPPPPPPPPPVAVAAPAAAPQAPAPPPAPAAPAQAGNPPFATALYDYVADANEDNEISFGEGDRISDLEFSDEAWWMGTTSDGSRGLFPSNYVQLDE